MRVTFSIDFDGGFWPGPLAGREAAFGEAWVGPGGLLGLLEGDAHVIRNAGGVVSDDVIRSLTISQRLLSTREIMLIHHTDCGMLTFKDADLKEQIEAEPGLKPSFSLEAFDDLDAEASKWLLERVRQA